MTILQLALVSLGLTINYPEISSLQSKGVWAIRIQDSNLAYLYSEKQPIGNACLTSEAAYIKNDKGRWRIEEAGPGKRLSIDSCDTAKPEDFKFHVMGDVNPMRLESALNRIKGELPREPHRSKIEQKEPFEVSASGDTISFSWVGQSLEIYKLTWDPEDNSITPDEYQEEVDPY